MSHTPHELDEDFPDHVSLLSQLKHSDPHFARLCAEYHTINRDIHRAETNIQPTDDLAAQDMRKRRLALKDEIWHHLKAAKSDD